MSREHENVHGHKMALPVVKDICSENEIKNIAVEPGSETTERHIYQG